MKQKKIQASWSEIYCLLITHLKGWAFDISPDGTEVKVFHRSNINYVRNILKGIKTKVVFQ